MVVHVSLIMQAPLRKKPKISSRCTPTVKVKVVFLLLCSGAQNRRRRCIGNHRRQCVYCTSKKLKQYTLDD